MNASLRILRLLIGITVCSLCSAPTRAQQESATPSRPFHLLERASINVPSNPEILRTQPVQVDLDCLAGSEFGRILNLTLAAETAYDAVVERSERRGPMQFTISGRLTGPQTGSFTIVVHKDVAVGIIRLFDLGLLYQLRYGADGVHLIQEIDPAQYPPEQCYAGGNKPALDLPEPPVQPPRSLAETDGARGGCQPPPPVYDLLMVYTHLARQAMGSTNAAIAQCQLAVEVGNEAYVNSQINIHLRLVHTMEVTYDESGDQEDWLNWLSNGYLASAIHQARDDYACDFVNMLTAGGSGIGWCGPGVNLAFTCAKWTRAVNSWTLVHEMGHNQGCDHNRENAGENCACSSHAYGYHFIGNSGTDWGTVMSYAGVRIPYFSNPGIYYDGQPTGVPIGDPGEAHCVQVHNAWIFYCEPYRLTRSDIWVEYNPLPWEQDGSWDHPYNTIDLGVDAIAQGVGPSELPRLWIKGSSWTNTGTFDKPMAIHACGEDVYIGVPE